MAIIETNQKGVDILFSDVLGTLIKYMKDDTVNHNKEFEKLSIMLNEYLSHNNYLSLVTSSSHACPVDIYMMLHDIISVIDPKYHNQIFYFVSMSGCSKETYEQYFEEGVKNPEFKPNAIIRKEESVPILLQRLNGIGIKNIYAVGDTYDDLGMLFATQQLGGTCGVIGNIKREELPCYTWAQNYYHKELRFIQSEYESFNLLERDPRYIEIYNRIGEKCREIEALIESGKISKESIMRECFLFSLLETYYFGHPKDDFYSNFERIKQFQVHSDFDSFYTTNLRSK